MDSTIGFEMNVIVVEAIRGRCASFTHLTATVSEILNNRWTDNPIYISSIDGTVGRLHIFFISNEFIHGLYLACMMCLLLRVVHICLGHKVLGTSIENKAISLCNNINTDTNNEDNIKSCT